MGRGHVPGPSATWLAFALAACGSESAAPVADAGAHVSESFSLLTYNVAGLPEGISASHPAKNTPLIGPLLNDYEIVEVQEDFAYHAQLIASSTHPYQTTPDQP
jgi:hypothetical protein